MESAKTNSIFRKTAFVILCFLGFIFAGYFSLGAIGALSTGNVVPGLVEAATAIASIILLYYISRQVLTQSTDQYVARVMVVLGAFFVGFTMAAYFLFFAEFTDAFDSKLEGSQDAIILRYYGLAVLSAGAPFFIWRWLLSGIHMRLWTILVVGTTAYFLLVAGKIWLW